MLDGILDLHVRYLLSRVVILRMVEQVVHDGGVILDVQISQSQGGLVEAEEVVSSGHHDVQKLLELVDALLLGTGLQQADGTDGSGFFRSGA